MLTCLLDMIMKLKISKTCSISIRFRRCCCYIWHISLWSTYTYGGASQPLVRQAVEGSGFAVALRVNDGGATAPYSLKGFQLEYQLGARR